MSIFNDQGPMRESGAMASLQRQIGSLREGQPTVSQRIAAEIEVMEQRLEQLQALKKKMDAAPEAADIINEIKRLGL